MLPVTLLNPSLPHEMDMVRVIFREYAESLGIDLRPLDTADYPNAAEMKRLYVRKAFRGFGLGRQLAEAALDAARAKGYACVLLDTLDEMESARALYADFGFVEIPPYYHNPIPGAHYLKADII